MTRSALLVIAGLAALSPLQASAQDALVRAAVDSGTLVRVHPDSGAAVRGRLTRTFEPSSATIELCPVRGPRCAAPGDSATIRRIPAASVSRLEVARGNHSATGAAIGGVFGLAFGLLAGAATDACVVSDCGGPSFGPILGGSLLVFSLIGALVGSGVPEWGPPP